MLDPDRRKSYGVTSAILAWLIVFTYIACYITSPVFEKLISGASSVQNDKPVMHLSFALAALILVILRLVWWLKNQRPVAPKTMSEKAYGVSRFTLLLMYLNVLQLSLTGLIYAWATGMAESVFGIVGIPVVDQVLAPQLLSLHSYSWQINLAIVAIYILVNGFFGFRYRLGYRRMLPGVHV